MPELFLQGFNTSIDHPSNTNEARAGLLPYKFLLPVCAINEPWIIQEPMVQRNRKTDNLAIEVPLLQYRKRVEQKYTAALRRALAQA